MYRHLVIFLCVLLTACASDIPKHIKEPVPDSPGPGDVHRNAAQYEQAVVRWGGVILELHNRSSDTLLEISGRELNSWGEPVNNDRGTGRFMVRVDSLLDESIYRKQRRITVYGHLEAKMQGLLGDHEARYPLVHADDHYLWSDNYYGYQYYDPFYDPYYHYPYPMRYRSRHFYPYRYGYYPLRYRYPFNYPFHYGYPRW